MGCGGSTLKGAGKVPGPPPPRTLLAGKDAVAPKADAPLGLGEGRAPTKDASPGLGAVAEGRAPRRPAPAVAEGLAPDAAPADGEAASELVTWEYGHGRGWRREPRAVAEALEAVWPGWLAGTEPAKRHTVPCGDAALEVDLAKLTGRLGEGRVFMLRRCVNGEQTHPDPARPHPWELRLVELRDSKDWLNNAFFWRAFSAAVAAAPGGAADPLAAHGMEEVFDLRHCQDFRTMTPGEAKRGGVVYRPPAGWKKFAIRVRGKFDGGDNTWLREDGKPGEWAVAYHGTHSQFLAPILRGGLKAGSRQAYDSDKDARTGARIGRGIYCTPDLGTAAGYAKTTTLEGKQLRLVMQCRVRPEAIKRCQDEKRADGAYWVINDPADIRPYGVLVQEATG